MKRHESYTKLRLTCKKEFVAVVMGYVFSHDRSSVVLKHSLELVESHLYSATKPSFVEMFHVGRKLEPGWANSLLVSTEKLSSSAQALFP